MRFNHLKSGSGYCHDLLQPACCLDDFSTLRETDVNSP